jgi:hypothetical protein
MLRSCSNRIDSAELCQCGTSFAHWEETEGGVITENEGEMLLFDILE